jgi:hypothetical protein
LDLITVISGEKPIHAALLRLSSFTQSEIVYGTSQRLGDRQQAIAKKVFDALCEKYPEISLNWRAILMPNWGRSGWSTFSNVLYGDYCSQPVQGHGAYSGHID